MTAPTTGIPRPPTAKLAQALVASCLVGLAMPVLGGVLKGAMETPVLVASALGAGCVLAAGVLALLVMVRLAKSTSEGVNLGTVVLAFSFVRLFGSVGVGLGVFLGLNPAKEPFVYAFLGASLLALFAETLILRSWSMRATGIGASFGTAAQSSNASARASAQGGSAS